MNEAIKILREARRLLAEKGWTKNSYACDVRGNAVYTGSGEAVKFCMLGAIAKVHLTSEPENGRLVPIDELPPYNAALSLLSRVVHDETGLWIPDFNDAPERTKEECLAVYDKAIELAAQE